MTKKIALTGATGFIGAALIDLFLSKGLRLKALAREPSRLAGFGDKIEVVEGNLENDRALASLAADADVFVHCAGVTHARRDEEYFAVNRDGALNAAKAAASVNACLVHLSSLSAREPSLSAYAASKRASEDVAFEATSESSCVVLRLPAIYGPGDMATLPFFKLIKRGIAPQPATATPARASILYVRDAASAVLTAVENPPANGFYEVNDSAAEGHSWTEIGETLGEVMNKSPRKIRAPRPIIAAYHSLAIASARLFNRVPDVRTGQINEFFHTDWVARDNLFGAATGWAPQYSLKEGFAKTVHWYQENGYL